MKKLVKKGVAVMVAGFLTVAFTGCENMTQEEIDRIQQYAQENPQLQSIIEDCLEEGAPQAELPASKRQGESSSEALERLPEGMPGRDHGMMQSVFSVDEANAIEDNLMQELDITQLIGTYTVNDTGVTTFYNNTHRIGEPVQGFDFYGQDANYSTNIMSFKDNGDGTVTDNNTGLIWLQDPGEKMTWKEALAHAESFEYAGHDDWRLPTIKELYSLIDFSGNSTDTPYIDVDYFVFTWGDATGERQIDSQYATSTIYESSTMGGSTTMFGVNFADGRIKGYPIDKEFYIMLVRGDGTYGVNNYVDNGDGTVTDLATGLMWMSQDSGDLLGDGGFMDWHAALEWAENLEYAGYDDWKLPDAKELQSVVDYHRSPDTTGSAAMDPVFSTTEIINLNGATDYGYYWTSTTHAEYNRANAAVYISFGRGMGEMNGTILDVHGAGAQRSDPKTGDEEDYPISGHGPQGDVQRVYNLVRLVRIVD